MEARGNQAGEHAGDVGTVVRGIKETVFPLANGQLQRPLRRGVLQGCPWHLQEARERLPMRQEIGKRFAYTTVGLHSALLALLLSPVLECLHNRPTGVSVVRQARLGA